MTERAIAKSREITERAREATWTGDSFLKGVFMGRLRPELAMAEDDRLEVSGDPRFLDFYERLRDFLESEVDPARIDAEGAYPTHVLAGLARLGAFGLKIPREYGGLGFDHTQYVQIMQLLGSYDANVTALLSAHQAIGVPHPVEMFGSDELKLEYLPRCARGAISAFALTEPAVGSDPGRLGTLARPTEDGAYFRLDGTKLWCTNGTLAELVVVLARNTETDRIEAFVVETDWSGVQVERRCRFMGLRALANAELSFRGVRVPRKNRIGPEGEGLRVALATLNTGRLTLPAATAGAAKLALEVTRKWARSRVQWGRPIGEHEAIGHRIADMASTTYAMESLATCVGCLADREDRDLRLEAAAAKEWNTTRGWEITNSALQIRGGRGFETELSLAARGEPPIGIERMLRDGRINQIFEGTSEIMHLFIAREALDEHLQLAGPLFEPSLSWRGRLQLLPRVLLFYARWYPALWVPFGEWFRFHHHGRVGRELRYAARTSRRLARRLFHAMARHGPDLEERQGLLFRAVDVALELFAMTACVLRVGVGRNTDLVREALAVRFCADARRRIEEKLKGMRDNDDVAKRRFGSRVLRGDFVALERGTMGVPYDEEALRPRTVEEWLARPETEAFDPGATPAHHAHG